MLPPLTLIRTLAVVLAATAGAAAQPRPGRALVAFLDASTRLGLAELEPLAGATEPFDAALLQALQTSSIALDATGNGLLVAGRTATQTNDAIFAAAIRGRVVQAPALFSAGLQGQVVGMDLARGGDVVVATTSGLWRVPAAGGRAQTLVGTFGMAATAMAVLATDEVVVVGTDPLGQCTVLLHDLASGGSRSLPMPRLATPVVVAPGPRPRSALVADASAQLYLIDLATFAAAPWTLLAGAAPAVMARIDDRDGWLLGRTQNRTTGLSLLAGTALIANYPLPAATAVLAIAYRPYLSRVAVYGAACGGTGTAPPEIAAAGRPLPGNSRFEVLLTGAPAATIAALLIGGRAVDLPLDRLGLPGCRLLADPATAPTLPTSAAGAAGVRLPIPPEANLVGLRLFCQWAVVALTANAGGLVASAGLAITI